MDKKQAINDLRRALRMAELPTPSDPERVTEADDNGNITAARPEWRLGYVMGCIQSALEALGANG